jgi:hypothetical protein
MSLHPLTMSPLTQIPALRLAPQTAHSDTYLFHTIPECVTFADVNGDAKFTTATDSHRSATVHESDTGSNFQSRRTSLRPAGPSASPTMCGGNRICAPNFTLDKHPLQTHTINPPFSLHIRRADVLCTWLRIAHCRAAAQLLLSIVPRLGSSGTAALS